MKNICSKLIDELDMVLFEPIPSQTSEGDRRSLLAIHSSIANRHERFTYLEIGSHWVDQSNLIYEIIGARDILNRSASPGTTG